MKLTLTPEELLKYINIPGMKAMSAKQLYDDKFEIELEPAPPPQISNSDPWPFWRSQVQPQSPSFGAPIEADGYATSTPAEEH